MQWASFRSLTLCISINASKLMVIDQTLLLHTDTCLSHRPPQCCGCDITLQSIQMGFSVPFWCRYTSYGRHFTQDKHLRALNEFLLPHIDDGDTVVDFSCGGNVWVPMLKEMCLEAGIVSTHPQLLLSATLHAFCNPGLMHVSLKSSRPGYSKG